MYMKKMGCIFFFEMGWELFNLLWLPIGYEYDGKKYRKRGEGKIVSLRLD